MADPPGRGKGPLALVAADSDIAFYVSQVASRGDPVLILGCADGRIGWELAGRGARVVGVDPSANMVAAAVDHRRSVEPEVGRRASFQVADVRSLRLKEKFRAVLAPQNAMGLVATLEELDAMLATAAYHLEPQGSLLLDAANPRRFELHPDPDEPLPSYVEPRRPLFAPHLRERRGVRGRGASIRRLRVGHFFPAEVDASLERAGLRALERYGSFGGAPFEPDAELQVVIAGFLAP
jgi:SAM-dependent methyltransferase